MPTMDGADDLITVEEAIERLGVSRATFYNHVRDLDRFRRVGDRRVLYRISDIELLAEPQPVRRDGGEQEAIVYKRARRGRATPKRENDG